ncbi:ABC transporter permease [Dactylosporangium sp. AC04546]|uniref:ABC transporter permease n=1 Tax=Dactylosporangium sp. AC04546 TaxID=2862460 RepID=UPI001EDF0C69|nr:ABC transporter permease [Dactylosporangium sp. AC04546]WVK80679.1 ABC transporter permease [Dactylosporangium sp. AC04546]
MGRYLAKRVALALLTLFLLSVIVFVAGQVLPGSPSRSILGNFASEQSIAQMDKQLGLDKPLPVQYWHWVTGLHGDLGTSYQYQAPVSTFLLPALWRSLQLAGLAFLIVVPLSICGGVLAALHRGRLLDRIISTGGLTLVTIPQFVSGVVLIVVFAIHWKIFPVTASAAEGSGILTQLRHLILPAIPLVLMLFGYIARMARASTVEALESDYVRTATLKGLPPRVVLFRHVLRNSMLPTIAVVATETGNLIGGLVVIETLFNYPGLGRLIYDAGNQKDFPMLVAGVLVIGVVYLVAALVADVVTTILNPRLRLEGVE